MPIQFTDNPQPEPDDRGVDGGNGQGHVQNGKQRLPFEDILGTGDYVTLYLVVGKFRVQNVDHLFRIIGSEAKGQLKPFLEGKGTVTYELEEGDGIEAEQDTDDHLLGGSKLSQDEVTVHKGEEQAPEGMGIAVEHDGVTETVDFLILRSESCS